MSNNTRRLNEILDTDPGARYTGEFSLGFNPYILKPMCDILFDEKIAGSLRRALGHGAHSAARMGRRRNLVRRRTDPQKRDVLAAGLEAAQSREPEVTFGQLRPAYFSSFTTARNCFMAGERTLFFL